MSLQIPGAKLLSRDRPCALCQREDAPLQLSHVLPAFVFKHAQVRTPTGYLRNSITPNRRMQDGPKEYILCSSCEQLFSGWERSFARIFKAHNETRGATITYTAADALCALSLVWRVLCNARLHPELNHLTFGSDYSRTDACFTRWSQSLLQNSNPGPYPLHWVFFDDVVGGSQLPTNINRYIFHGTDFDLLANSRESFVYVHIPGILIFGLCEGYDKREWKGTKIAFGGGRYFRDNKQVPGYVGTLIHEKAAVAAKAKASISPAQREKIRASVLKDPEALLRSPVTRSIIRDMQLGDSD